MGKKDIEDLTRFLRPFPRDVTRIALGLREFVWELYPKANELIYDNYNAVAFGWSPTEKLGHTFCSIAVGRRSLNVHFGFYWGSKIDDPKNMLLGGGNQYRYIIVKDLKTFPRRYIRQMVKKAYAYSLSRIKDATPGLQGASIIKSISAKKAQRAAAKH